MTVKPYNTGQTKKEEVREMFDNIAPKYDLLNHTLLMNIDRTWSGSFRERQLPETCPGEQSTYTTATRPHRKMIIPFFHPVCKRVSCLSTGTNQPSFFHF